MILLSEIIRSAPERRRESIYYIALGHYKLGQYSDAKRYNDKILEHQPNNMQALSLQKLIEEKVASEGMMGVAIVGGLAVAATVVGGLLFKGARRK